MSTPLADEFAAINEALKKIEQDKRETEVPKAWPDFTSVEQVYGGGDGDVWGHYSAPELDCAWCLRTRPSMKKCGW